MEHLERKWNREESFSNWQRTRPRGAFERQFYIGWIAEKKYVFWRVDRFYEKYQESYKMNNYDRPDSRH